MSHGVGDFVPTRAGRRKPSLKARRIPRLANQLKRWRCAPKQEKTT